MNGLTKRQIVALEILKQHKDLITNRMDKQNITIQNALDFADYFLELSEGEEKGENYESIKRC